MEFAEYARREAFMRAEVSVTDNKVKVTAPYVSYGAGVVTITTDQARRMARKHVPGATLVTQRDMFFAGGRHVWYYAG